MSCNRNNNQIYPRMIACHEWDEVREKRSKSSCISSYHAILQKSRTIVFPFPKFSSKCNFVCLVNSFYIKFTLYWSYRDFSNVTNLCNYSPLFISVSGQLALIVRVLVRSNIKRKNCILWQFQLLILSFVYISSMW